MLRARALLLSTLCLCALAPLAAGAGEHCQGEIRDKRLLARVGKPPFVPPGRALIE